MPSSVGPNTFGEENLVFGYDLGDVSNSYKGEPTTNQLTNSDFSNGTTGWTFGSWDGGRYTYTTETVTGPFGKPVTALKVVRTTSDTSYAHFHQGNNGKFTSGNTYTISVYVKGSGTLGQYNQGGYSPIVYRPGQFVTLSNEWTRISYTLTSQTDTLYPYWAAENITQNVPMYFVFAQSEGKDHVTPYVAGTRSATQGLIDLTGNSTIDLTNVSFDSNAQIDYDGSNDYASLGNPTVLRDLTTGTIETVYYRDTSTGTYQMVFTDAGSDLEITYSGNVLQFYIGNSGLNYTHAVTGQYFHVTGTWGPGFKRLYLNGVEVASGTNTGIDTGNRDRYVGGRGTSFSFNGKIPMVKIYSRTLTASEVRSNFNAIKGRFNI